MLAHVIGEITLSFSTFVYFIWFLPQLWLNFKRKDTEGLSYWMHGLLFLGYSADLMYGFGLHMQWQYRATTIFGLINLAVQHYQIGRYGLHRRSEVYHYIAISVLVLVLFTFSILTLALTHESKSFYNAMGMIEDACWATYLLPQIIRNYVNKSTRGLSIWFFIIDLSMSFCDIVSALALGWDWPSLVGVPVDLLKKSAVLFQFYWYGGKRRLKRNQAV